MTRALSTLEFTSWWPVLRNWRLTRFLQWARYPRPFDNAVAELGTGLVGAEVGVFEGEHAAHLLKIAKPKLLYLVDPYTDFGEPGMGTLRLLRAKGRAVARLQGKSVRWVPLPSTSARIGSLDFVYIDGNHRHEAVKDDLRHWWEQIKRGGILGGHDYSQRACPGVFRAVNDFADEVGLQVFTEGPDWWIYKT